MAAVHPAGWSSRKQVSISHLNVDELLSDFPLYLPVKGDGDMTEAQDDGEDWRVRLDDSAVDLDYEREAWSGGGGAAVTADHWTSVPEVSAVAPTVVHCFYGNAGAADGQDAANTWDSNYQLVWHSADDPDTSTVQDSTGNSNDGSKHAANEPNEVAGIVHNAQDFDGNDDEIESGANIGITGSQNRTLECWLKTSDNASNMVASSWGGASNYQECAMMFRGSGAWRIAIISGNRVWSDGYADGAWHHVAIVLDGEKTSDCTGYFDGAVSPPDSTDDAALNTVDSHLFVGSRRSSEMYWDGIIDEVRVSDTARSAAWMKFQVANVANEGNELTWGEEESAGETIELAGSSAAAAALSAALSRERGIVGTVAGAASLSAAAKRARGIIGSAAGAATVAGAVKRARGIIGTVAAGGSLSAALKRGRKIAGAVAASCTPTGVVKRARGLIGAVAASCTPAGALKRARGLVGAVSAAASLTGRLRGRMVALIGSIAARASLTGLLRRLYVTRHTLTDRTTVEHTLTDYTDISHTLIDRTDVSHTLERRDS